SASPIGSRIRASMSWRTTAVATETLAATPARTAFTRSWICGASSTPSRRDPSFPVLLIHGALDHETPPDHSQRVFDALPGPKRLIVVPGVGHNQSLSGPVWRDIDEWISAIGSNSAAGRWPAPADSPGARL